MDPLEDIPEKPPADPGEPLRIVGHEEFRASRAAGQSAIATRLAAIVLLGA